MLQPRHSSFAVEIGYATPDTIGPMLQKAQTKARALVLEAGIPVPSMMEFILAKAAANAKAIATPGQWRDGSSCRRCRTRRQGRERREEG